MKKMLSLSLVLGLSLAVSSCANKATKAQIEDKIDHVSASEVKHFQKDIRKTITESTELNDEQKTKLLALDDKTVAQQKAITEELAKAKIVLVELISQRDMKRKEYDAIKKKIVELNKQRVQNGFKSAKEAREILFPKKATTAEEKSRAKDREIYNVIYRHHLNDL